MTKHRKMEKPIAVVTAIALTFSLMVAPGVASAAGEYAAGTIGADVPEWADGGGFAGDLTTQAALPASFDMRDKGWVTPVKLQNPWQTCWAFGATAATESSILSSTGSTYADTGLDLSERHLAWFAVHHITEAEDPAQAGEGCYPFKDGNAAFDTGGMNILVTTVFSQGVGPVTEADFPYRGIGADGTSHTKKPNYPYEKFVADPDQGTLEVIAELNGFSTVAEAEALLRAAAVKDKITYEQELYSAYQYVLSLYQSTEYSKADDWSIPETDANGALNRFKHAGLIMKDGNVLPEYWNADRTAINDASMTAMKQELENGRGVCIGYLADQAQPGQVSDGTYMNRENWAQYTFNALGMDHAVCIVGWDDDYPASNFTHNLYVLDENGKPIIGEDGKPLIDPDSDAKTTPPGNGAWIVKNSWGSETDAMADDLGNPTGGGTYGVRDSEGKATGYFYLSYYDKTIRYPETMSFSSNLLGPTGAISIFQHDYMPATGSFYSLEPTSDVMSSANVFDLAEGMDDQVIASVGGRTLGENQRMTFAIYQLNDDATEPTDGKLLCRTSSSFDYAGYHRLDLEQPLAIRAGHKYSIVSTVSAQDANGSLTYSVTANQGVSKQIRDWQSKQKGAENTNFVYTKAVVNEGESFLYKDGKWVDWSKYIPEIPGSAVPEEVQPAGPFERYTDALPIDNFSIKMYAEPATITLTHQEAKAPTCTEQGNIEYWYYDAIDATDTSEGLRVCYKDKDGNEMIEQADTVLPALGHTWGAWTKLDDKQHQRVCERDSSHVETADHEWDEGKVTKEPSATQDGVRTYTCKVCDATKTESIAKSSATTKASAAKTGDTLLFATIGVIALAAAAAVALALANRKRRRD